mgnify:CR=1 FL=1
MDGALEGDVVLDFTGLFPPRTETIEDTSTQDILEDIQNQITQLQSPDERDDSFAFGLDTHSETQAAIQEEFSEAWSTIEEDKIRIQAAQDKAAQADVNAGLALEAASEAVVSSEIQYVLSISDTTPPGPEAAWSPTSPERTPGAFIWMRTKVTRGNDEVAYSAPALITGNDGSPGESGTDAKNITLTSTSQVFSVSSEGVAGSEVARNLATNPTLTDPYGTVTVPDRFTNQAISPQASTAWIPNYGTGGAGTSSVEGGMRRLEWTTAPTAGNPRLAHTSSTLYVPVTAGETVTVSMDVAGSTRGRIALDYNNDTGWVSSTSLGWAVISSDINNPTRLVWTGVIPAGITRLLIFSGPEYSTALGNFPTPGTWFAAGRLKVETGNTATAYFDGDTPTSGNTVYGWTGPVNASTSYARYAVAVSGSAPKARVFGGSNSSMSDGGGAIHYIDGDYLVQDLHNPAATNQTVTWMTGTGGQNTGLSMTRMGTSFNKWIAAGVLYSQDAPLTGTPQGRPRSLTAWRRVGEATASFAHTSAPNEAQEDTLLTLSFFADPTAQDYSFALTTGHPFQDARTRWRKFILAEADTQAEAERLVREYFDGDTSVPGMFTEWAGTAKRSVSVLRASTAPIVPETITVTADAAHTSVSQYTYSVDGKAFSSIAPFGVSRAGNVVTFTGKDMRARTVAIKASDSTDVSDTLTVAKIADGTAGTAGADAYTVLLSNEAHVFAGGTTSALAATTTSTVIAYKGSTQQSATVGTITGQVTGLTTSIASNGTTAPVITLTATTSLTTKNGTLTVPVTVDGTTFTKTIAWSLSLTGATGTPGANAAVVSLTASSQALTVPNSGGATNPATSTVTGNAVNTTISAWTYSVDGGSFSSTLPTGVTRSGNVVTITGATVTARTITVKMADANGVSDTLTVARILDGSPGPAGLDAYTVLLSNEAHTFAGTTTSAVASTTTSGVSVYKGSTLQPVTSVTVTGQVTGLTTSVAGQGTTTPVVTLTATTALVAQSGQLTLTIVSDGQTFTKLMTWSVSRTGATGTNAVTATLGSDAVALPCTSAGATSAAQTLTIPFSAYQGASRVAVTCAVGALPSGITVSSNTAGTTSASGSLVLAVANASTLGGTDAGDITLTLTAAGTTYPCTYSWSKAKAGAAGTAGTSATTVDLGSDSVTIPCTSAGATSAASTITIPFSGWVGNSRVATTAAVGTLPSGITVSSNTAGTTGAAGSLVLAVANASTLGGTSTGDITITLTASSIAFPRRFSWSKATAGATGSQGVSVTSIVSYFAALPQGSSAPATPGNVATPPAPWVATEPTYAPATELWRTERIAYSNSTYSYTTPQKSSAWAAAVYIGNLNDAAIKGLVRVSSTDPGFFEGRIWWETYPAGDPKAGQVKAIKYSASASGPWVPYMLAANDVLVPGSVKAGTIDTDDLAAEVAFVQKFIANQAFMKEVYANKVLVASDNILPDPAISNPLFWASSPYFSATGGKSGTGSLQIPQNSVQSELYNSSAANVSTYGIRVEEGKSYVFSAWAKSLDAAHDSANKISIYVRGHNEAGTQTVGPTIIAQSPGAAIDTWVKLEGVYGPIPSGTTRIAVGYYKQASLTNSRVWFSDPIVKERVGAISLEDGVVTADKVDTGSLVAGNVLVAGGNLIRDTTFTYWRPWGGSVSQWSVQPTGGPNSTPALAIAAGAANYGGQLGSDNFTQFRVDAQPNSRYSLSAWVHCTTAIPVGGVSLGIGRINFSGVKSDTSASNTVIIPANTWTKLTVYVNTLADTVQIGFYLVSREVNSTGVTKFSAPYCSAPASLVVDGEITGTTITGGLVQTNANANRGIKIKDDEILIYDADGNLDGRLASVPGTPGARVWMQTMKVGSAGWIGDYETGTQFGRVNGTQSNWLLAFGSNTEMRSITSDRQGRISASGARATLELRKTGIAHNIAEFTVDDGINGRGIFANVRNDNPSIADRLYMEITRSKALFSWDGSGGLEIEAYTKPSLRLTRGDSGAGAYLYTTSNANGELGIRLRPYESASTDQMYWYLSSNGGMRSVVGGVTRDHPFATYTNTVSLSPAAANTTYTLSVSYPSGRFTSTPTVVLTPISTNPTQRSCTVISSTSSGFSLQYSSTVASNFSCNIIAIQATA